MIEKIKFNPIIGISKTIFVLIILLIPPIFIILRGVSLAAAVDPNPKQGTELNRSTPTINNDSSLNNYQKHSTGSWQSEKGKSSVDDDSGYSDRADPSGFTGHGYINFNRNGHLIPIRITPQEFGESSSLPPVDIDWFSILTGIASVLGLIVSIYPIQIKNLPPSLFRSILWKKALLLSFGVGIIVFSLIKLYTQHPQPDGFLFGWPYSIMHGKSYDSHSEGPLIWGILFTLGIALLLLGKTIDPIVEIRERLISEGKRIFASQKEDLGKILNQRNHNEISAHEQKQYEQLEQYYRMLQLRIVDLLAGFPITSTRFGGDIATNASYQVDQILSLVRNSIDGLKENNSKADKSMR